MKPILYRIWLLGMALVLAFGAWGVMPVQRVAAAETLFTETMGTVTTTCPSGTTAISTFESNNCYDNDAFTMSGTGDMRTTTPSSGYTGASGEWNVFLTNTIGRYFQIAGIDTSDHTDLVLSFGVYKSTTTENGSNLIVEVSSNGTDWTALTVPALPTGSGTAIWHHRTAAGSIPSTETLYIRFMQNSTSPQFRIDDVRLMGTPLSVDLTDFSAAWQGDAVLVRWETAQELDNLGFNLYRSDTDMGPWVKLNDALIPSQNPGAVFGAVYEWLDADVTPGATYFYRLEDVDIYFVSTFHGPVSTAPVDPSAVSLVAFGSRPAIHVGVLLGVVGVAGLLKRRRKAVA